MAETDELTLESKTDNPYGRAGGAVPSTPKVVGDKEAEASGLYETGAGVKELLGIADQTKQLNTDLTAITKGQMATRQDTDKRYEYLLGADRQRMQTAFDAASAGPGSLPPAWDSNKEREDRIRGPMENFGSIASVFAMGASMFTRTPMTSALNAGAAAMEAIKNSDEKGYESAYQAWKDNTNLAIKRFEMEEKLFTNANKLFDVDQGMWKTKTLANAAQFDDQKTIAFLNAGMHDKVLEVQAALVKGKVDLAQSVEKMETIDIKQKLLKAAKSPEEQVDILRDFATGKPSVEEQLLRQKRREYSAQNNGKQMPADEQVEFITDIRQNSRKLSTNDEVLAQWKTEFEEREKRPPTADETKAFLASMPGKAGSQNTKGAELNRRTDEIIKKAEAEGKTIDRKTANDQARQEIARADAAVSGNKRVELQSRYDKFTHSNEVLDKTLGVLNKYTAAAGLPGKAMRLEERLENMAARGKISQTDRVQMMRDVELLKGWTKNLLFEKQGKGLKAEYDSLNSIVAGLSAGDTTANTIRALTDLKKLFTQMQSETKAQIEGNWTPETSKPSVPAADKPKGRWQNDPVVSP